MQKERKRQEESKGGGRRATPLMLTNDGLQNSKIFLRSNPEIQGRLLQRPWVRHEEGEMTSEMMAYVIMKSSFSLLWSRFDIKLCGWKILLHVETSGLMFTYLHLDALDRR